MTDTFISYSRTDSEFVRKLFDALEATGRDAWIDWEGIASAAPDFLAEIFVGIEAANNFLLIMSPSSLKSEICNLEIAHAIEHHKRIVPVRWCRNGSVPPGKTGRAQIGKKLAISTGSSSEKLMFLMTPSRTSSKRWIQTSIMSNFSKFGFCAAISKPHQLEDLARTIKSLLI